MRSQTTARAAVLTLLGTLALTACATTPPMTQGGEEEPVPDAANGDLAQFYGQETAWSDCGRYECATVSVPVDYDDPQAGSLELALERRVPSGGRIPNRLRSSASVSGIRCRRSRPETAKGRTWYGSGTSRSGNQRQPPVAKEGSRVSGLRTSGAVAVDVVVGMEARGFLFGAPVALALGVGFVPVRKPGKLPGATVTQRHTSLIENKAAQTGQSTAAVEAAMLKLIPAGRFGQAQEVAAAVAFVASPAAAYLNGINVPVDGGRTSTL